MIDAGRNYMSMDLLKQQIDVMARHKFNVFHFHSTEDIARRFAIKQYPLVDGCREYDPQQRILF
jgi:hexosaminidase